jgi:hypothetical protein
VNSVARDGQQSAVEAKARSKVVPVAASDERTPGITRMDSTVWSSVMITITFGRPAPVCPGAPEWPHPAKASATPSSAGQAARGPTLSGRRAACGRG